MSDVREMQSVAWPRARSREAGCQVGRGMCLVASGWSLADEGGFVRALSPLACRPVGRLPRLSCWAEWAGRPGKGKVEMEGCDDWVWAVPSGKDARIPICRALASRRSAFLSHPPCHHHHRTSSLTLVASAPRRSSRPLRRVGGDSSQASVQQG